MKTMTIGIFILLMLICSVVGFWLVEPPSPPSTSITQEARGKDGRPQTEFRAGEILYIFSHQKLLRSIPRTAIQSIWNEDTGVISVRFGSLLSPPPTPDGITFQVPLPAYMEPGTYTHRVEIHYGLNPFKSDEVFHLPNTHFRIVR